MHFSSIPDVFNGFPLSNILVWVLMLYHSLPSFIVLKSPTVLSEQRKLAIQFHLECTYISLIYCDYKSAKEHIQRAQELSGLSIKMTGKTCDTSSMKQNSFNP